MKNIRNFCIIAHIDHGKSTLADRLLEFTNTIQVTNGQMLDDMDLEKERGITIKSHAIQMEYTYKGEKYILNLIDTPGHVDFSYEVSRSIAACEGALLIVDASQGVQAQTISNLYMAIEHDLEIIPVINKCDMASAMPEEVEDEIVELLGCKRDEIIRASGKTGMGVEEILAAVIERIPHPEGDEEAPLQALIFDSVFNSFRGIIAYFKIVNGVIRMVPAIRTMGILPFLKYLVVSVLIHHGLLLTLEFFSFAHIGTLLLRIAASTLLTVTCIMAVEGIRKKG